MLILPDTAGKLICDKGCFMLSKTRQTVLLTFLVLTTVSFQVRPAQEPLPPFDRTETMIVMRDGVRLHTNIFSVSSPPG